MRRGTLAFVAASGQPGTWPERACWAIEGGADVMIRLKRMFPRAEKHRRAYITLDDTREVRRDLEWVLMRWDLQVSSEDRDRLTVGAAEHREREQAVAEILSGDRPHLPFMEPAREPREYQLVAADLALTTGRLLLTDELGLGKSMTGLLALRNPDVLPALVVCPTHLPQQWMEELAKTLPWLRGHIIRTGRAYDPAQRREMKGHDPDVLFVNYHKLRGWVDTLAGRVRTVIFDEAQELRRADSDKYKAAARIADAADLRIGLTATPVYNYAGEIHNVMSVLAPDALGNREEFAREWGGGGYWHDKLKVKDPKALGEYLRGEGLMLRRTRKDVGRELPDVVRVPHSVDADERVHAELMEGTLDLARTILDATDRKQAFTASGDLDWRVRRATGISKAPYVAEFVKLLLEAEEKVVLWGWHRDVYEIWLDKLAEFNPVLYTGSESPAQKERSRLRFLGGEPLANARDEAWRSRREEDWEEGRILIMSLRSGAGLDGLQEAAHVGVFGELDWSPGMHDQCVGRLHRDGQGNNVMAYFLVSDQGSDPLMAEVLNVKRMQSEPLRDPDAELFEEAADTGDRVRRLAAAVLQKRGQAKAA